MKSKETLFFNSCFWSPRWERLNYIHKIVLKLEDHLKQKKIHIPSPEAQKYLESIIKHYKISPQEIWEYFQKRNTWFFLEKNIRDFREIEIHRVEWLASLIDITRGKAAKYIRQDFAEVRQSLEITTAIQKKKKQEEYLNWGIITVLWIKYWWDDKKFFIEKFKEKKWRNPVNDAEIAHFVADTPSVIQQLNATRTQKK